MTEVVIFKCENIGVAGTTECFVMDDGNGKFEARMGISIMGCTNMDDEGFKQAEYNPFHDKFYDNYAYGVGDDKDSAIADMKKQMKETAESLWF